MAGSRREAIGSIFKRIQGLLKSGAMKEEDRPIWYDVVKAIPPKPLPPPRKVQKILYPEDFVRVQFHKVYSYNGVASLSDESFKSIPDRFVDTYMELHKKQLVSSDKLFEETAQTLKEKGLNLVRNDKKKSEKATSPPTTSQTKMETEKESKLDLDSLFSEET